MTNVRCLLLLGLRCLHGMRLGRRLRGIGMRRQSMLNVMMLLLLLLLGVKLGLLLLLKRRDVVTSQG